MEKENIVVGIYSSKEGLSFVAEGLLKGFEQIGVKALTVNECIEQNITPNLAIAIDSEGLNSWQKLLNKNTTSIMWSTESVFSNNLNIIKQFSAYKNFILFVSTMADNAAIGAFIPSLVHGYIPPAVDADFCKNDGVEKISDITLIAKNMDVDAAQKNLKSSFSPQVYKILNEIINIVEINPSLSIWDICKIFQKEIGLKLNIDQYALFINSVSDIVTAKQSERVFEQIKDFNLTIVGNDYWKKYENNNIKVVCSKDESVIKKAIQGSKVAIVVQDYALTGGLDANIVKAAGYGTFVLTGINPFVKNELQDTVGYYNPVNFADLKEKVQYYLSNEKERINLVQQSQEIVFEKHLWKNRAQNIFDVIRIK